MASTQVAPVQDQVRTPETYGELKKRVPSGIRYFTNPNPEARISKEFPNPKRQIQNDRLVNSNLSLLNFLRVSNFGFRVFLSRPLAFILCFIPLTSYFLLLSPLSSLAQEPSPIAAPAHNSPIFPSVVTYDQLISAIRKTRSESRARIEAVVRQEKVRESWEIGKLIDEHVLHHQERADYGAQVLKRIAKDLETSHTELKYMLQFARTYPISPPADQLSWAHYRELLSVNDPDERQKLAEQAQREKWGRDRLRHEIKNILSENSSERGTLSAQLDQVGVYRIIRAQSGPYKGQLMLDLGFSNYYHPEGEFDFTEGDIVEINDQRLVRVDIRDSSALLYTYHAYPIKVIDGDTIAAVIDLGFGITTVQALRLRGLDAPEIESAEGKGAKGFLEKLLTKQPIIIRTTHSDKYDRYLVDIFVDDLYVNQELVEQGHAVIVES